MSDEQNYRPNYHYPPDEVRDAMNFEEDPLKSEQEVPVSEEKKSSSRRPKRAEKKEKGFPFLPVLLVTALLGLLIGGGAKLAQNSWHWAPAGGESSGDADPGFGFDFDEDVEVNSEANEAYSLPVYEGDSSGLTIDLNEPSSTESSTALSPVDFYKAQLPSTVSITVYAGKSAAYGSGMILTADGYILTCAHVIENTETCVVTLSNEKQYDAKLVGSDDQTDIAVLKIDAKGLEPVTFCDSDRLEIGETVYVIGDPLGPQFRSSLSDGILSGLNRSVSSGGYAQMLMQVTAPVNSGNSGGPLFNRFGQVIGMVNMKMSSGSFSAASIDNMGLSIPSQTLKQIVESLCREGIITRPVLGITCYSVDEVHARLSGMPEGLMVTSIDEKSDCAAQGILLGDFITEADGTPVHTVPDFQRVIAGKKPGDTVILTIWRDMALAEEYIARQQEGDSSEDASAEASESSEGEASSSEEERTYNFEYLGEISVRLISSGELGKD